MLYDYRKMRERCMSGSRDNSLYKFQLVDQCKTSIRSHVALTYNPLVLKNTNMLFHIEYLSRKSQLIKIFQMWISCRRRSSFLCWFLCVWSIPVATGSKGYVCGRSLAEIAGSNPAGGMDVCVLWVLCVVTYRSMRRADPSSRGKYQTCASPNVIRWNHNPLHL